MIAGCFRFDNSLCFLVPAVWVSSSLRSFVFWLLYWPLFRGSGQHGFLAAAKCGHENTYCCFVCILLRMPNFGLCTLCPTVFSSSLSKHASQTAHGDTVKPSEGSWVKSDHIEKDGSCTVGKKCQDWWRAKMGMRRGRKEEKNPQKFYSLKGKY